METRSNLVNSPTADVERQISPQMTSASIPCCFRLSYPNKKIDVSEKYQVEKAANGDQIICFNSFVFTQSHFITWHQLRLHGNKFTKIRHVQPRFSREDMLYLVEI